MRKDKFTLPKKVRWHSHEKLKGYRSATGMNQSEFASAINLYMRECMPLVYRPSMDLTQSMISDLELGRTDFSLPALYATASLLEVGINDLLVSSLGFFSKNEVSIVVGGYGGGWIYYRR